MRCDFLLSEFNIRQNLCLMKVRIKLAIRQIITDFVVYEDSKFNLSKLSTSSLVHKMKVHRENYG